MERVAVHRTESRPPPVLRRLLPALGVIFGCAAAVSAQADSIGEQLSRGLGDLAPARTEVLYDRVLPLSGIERFRGDASSARGNAATWRQLYDELQRASNRPERRPSLDAIELRAREQSRAGVIPIAVLLDRYERIRPDALDRGSVRLRDGRLEAGVGEPLEEARAFAVAALTERTYQGSEVTFALEPSLAFSFTGSALQDLELDAGDGLGFRRPSAEHRVRARYEEIGTKTLRLRARSGEESLTASFDFTVEALATPAPSETLHVTASIPYQGTAGSGNAYVDLATGHTTLRNPVILVEGLDVENSLGWEEMYAQLNRENLLEDLRAQGYDVVVLDFTDATDYIQRNAFVLTELLQRVEEVIDPRATVTVVGASMGGLVSRYALAWLESQGIPHRASTLICLDTPNRGANVPLGIQYWVQFFSGQAAAAAHYLERLDRPAVRQMLVYHYTNPPSLGQSDALKTALAADFAAVGNYPTQPRLVAIANGSGQGAGQGFSPSSQIVRWNYSTFWVRVLGDVWAVPFNGQYKIFDGEMRTALIGTRRTISVSGTLPYDNAPGGWRNTMQEMDAVQAPYGDIVALYPNHCFVPTVSALDLDTDLLYDVSADPSRLSHTPFDTIYSPATNQEHTFITPENAIWLRSEITREVIAASTDSLPSALRLAKPWPSPSAQEATRIGFDLPRPSAVSVRLFDVRGRVIRDLFQGALDAGLHELVWEGRDEQGRRAAAGIYFARLEAGGEVRTASVVRLR